MFLDPSWPCSHVPIACSHSLFSSSLVMTSWLLSVLYFSLYPLYLSHALSHAGNETKQVVQGSMQSTESWVFLVQKAWGFASLMWRKITVRSWCMVEGGGTACLCFFSSQWRTYSATCLIGSDEQGWWDFIIWYRGIPWLFKVFEGVCRCIGWFVLGGLYPISRSWASDTKENLWWIPELETDQS